MANRNLAMALNFKGSITEKYINKQPQYEGKCEQFWPQYHDGINGS